MAVPQRQPIDVLVDGDWVPGWLNAWIQGPDGSWRGDISYTREVDLATLTSPGGGGVGMALLTWEQVRPAGEIRQRPVEAHT